MAKKINQKKAQKAAGAAVVATAAGAAYAASKKKKKLFVALLILLVVVIVGVLIFGYYQGWFDAILKPQQTEDPNGGTGGTGGGSGGGSGSGGGTGGSGGSGSGDGTVADMEIHFMQLGYNSNGDSIYIKAGDTDILIDAGCEKGSAKTITQYVDKYCKDGKLEYVIATHADTDHINAFIGTSTIKGIFDYYECENIIQFARTGKDTSKDTTAISQYYAKVEAERALGANVYTALDCVKETNGAKKVYQIAEGITMEILYQKYYETNTSNENDYSVCLMFTQGDNHYLFLGDLEEKGEASLIQENPDLPKVELYKAGHHGSKTSANQVLLEKIQPQYVCISCVAGNVEYLTTGEQVLHNAFPTQDFINRIAPYTDKVYVTGQTTIKKNANNRWVNDTYSPMNGNITFSCKNGVIEVHGDNNDTLLKDTQWFADYRDCPTAWQ